MDDGARTILLGPAGTVRDLVAAVLSLEGFRTEIPEPGASPGWGPDDVLVLVTPGAEEWAAARRRGGGIVLVAERALGDDAILEAVLRGADAIVSTDGSPFELGSAVHAVRQGQTLLRPTQARRLAVAARSGYCSAKPLRLTPREASILISIERGESVKQTARSLGIATKTVENLQSRLFRKLGARNRAHAVSLVHRLGLLEPATTTAAQREHP